jgi:hypothetical protein
MTTAARELMKDNFWCPVISSMKPTEPVPAFAIPPKLKVISSGQAAIKSFPDRISRSAVEKRAETQKRGRLNVMAHCVTT